MSVMPYPNLITATRMLGNLVAAIVLLAVAIAILRLLHRNSQSSGGSSWTPLVAFVCGPVLSTLYFFVDVLWLGHGSYSIPSDYYDTYWRVLVIGFVAGALGAVVFWFEARFTA